MSCSTPTVNNEHLSNVQPVRGVALPKCRTSLDQVWQSAGRPGESAHVATEPKQSSRTRCRINVARESLLHGHHPNRICARQPAPSPEPTGRSYASSADSAKLSRTNLDRPASARGASQDLAMPDQTCQIQLLLCALALESLSLELKPLTSSLRPFSLFTSTVSVSTPHPRPSRVAFCSMLLMCILLRPRACPSFSVFSIPSFCSPQCLLLNGSMPLSRSRSSWIVSLFFWSPRVSVSLSAFDTV